MTFNRNNTRTNIFTWLWPASLVNATITPRGRDEGQRQGQGQGEKTIFLHGMIRFYGLYRDAVWGLKIGFRGVIFPGSGCIYLETVQYGCFCLKILEIVADIYIGTVQTSARENIS